MCEETDQNAVAREFFPPPSFPLPPYQHQRSDLTRYTHSTQAYISSYAGYTKARRLMFIALKSKGTHSLQKSNSLEIFGYHQLTSLLLPLCAHAQAGTPMEIDALRRAIDEIKKGENTIQYKEAIKMLDGRGGSGYGMDTVWVDSVERNLRIRTERAESDLAAAKNNMIKVRASLPLSFSLDRSIEQFGSNNSSEIE